MDCHNAAGQVLIGHLAEAGLAQDLAEPFLIGERADRGGQILIHAGGIPRDLRPDPGQQFKRIPIIERAQPAEDRPGELQADKRAAGFHHAANLSDRLRQISDIPHAEAGRHCIERVVRESEMLRIGLQAGDFAGASLKINLLETFSEHRVIEIGRDDAAVGPHAGLNQQGQVCGAGSHIERSSLIDVRDERCRDFLPAVMESETQQRVVQVVDARDGGEHPLHGLFARRSGPG